MKQRSIVAALGGIAVVATWLFQFGVDRRAVLSSLAAGTYRFKVFPEDIAFEPEYIELEEASNTSVEVTWRNR
jgi:hypothetical protein